MQNPDSAFKPEDVINEPEMKEALTRIAVSLIEVHKSRDDDDTYTVADVSAWDQEFRNLLRIPAVMQIFSIMFEERGYVVGVDANDDTVLIVSDKSFLEENEEHCVKLDPEAFNAFIESIPPEDRAEAVHQMIVSRRKPKTLN